MTTTFLLVRHAAHDRVGSVLCGRMSGVRLCVAGRDQAFRLGERIAREDVATIRTSPLERAQETADAIAARLGQQAEPSQALVEIDVGAWTGLSFRDLEADPRWSAWNASRSVSRPPDGETMLEAQVRIVGAMEAIRRACSGRAAVLVSHGDVIKAALLYYLGLPIDAYGRFDVDPGSISTILIGEWGARVVRLNEVVPQ